MYLFQSIRNGCCSTVKVPQLFSKRVVVDYVRDEVHLFGGKFKIRTRIILGFEQQRAQFHGSNSAYHGL